MNGVFDPCEDRRELVTILDEIVTLESPTFFRWPEVR